jgi:biuret amidohydrolase
VQPGHTALLTVEVQEAVVGKRAVLPALAEAVAESGMLSNIAALARAARAAGAPVVHCTAEFRADGFGANRNSRLFGATRKARGGKAAPADAFSVHAEVGAEPTDIVLPRIHGASPMTGTSLDTVLRNEGVTTIVATGVSMNVALLGLVFEAVNRSYQVVVPRDAVCGVDATYVDAVLDNTVAFLATVTTTEAVIDAWSGATT